MGHRLRDECATLNGCSVGEANITGAHGLPAKHVIHTVGPRSGDEKLIHCYQSCFSICEERNLQTIEFPCISTGHFGFPKERAAHLAVGTVKEILASGSSNIERVIFCVFTADDVEIYEWVLHEYFPVDPVSEGEPVARRGVPYISGVYIEGMVHRIEANFTVDTGATITMMSRDVYERIPENHGPPLDKCSSPATADGRLMKAYGSAVFEIDLGPLMLDKTIAVAELADEVLVGADVLQFDPGGPADLILSQGVMVLRGKSIPVLQIGSRTMVRKVRSADHYTLPPMTEMIVDAFVDRHEDMTLDTQLLIEPSLYLAREYSAVVAPCLIDASWQCTVKVRIMNPTCEVISVKQDMVLGDVTATEGEPMVLFDEESNNGNKSLSQARRVDDTMCETRHDANEASLIPDHLRVTFQTACDICETDEQKNKIEHLLNQFSPVFSVEEYDLGLTYITEHAIEMEDARPIKQPPRRVPMAFTGEDKEAIDKLWKQGSIRPSTSPWASPIVLVRKKDG